jgi:hypothetical protein
MVAAPSAFTTARSKYPPSSQRPDSGDVAHRGASGPPVGLGQLREPFGRLGLRPTTDCSAAAAGVRHAAAYLLSGRPRAEAVARQ